MKPVLLIDFGSTFTKATAVDIDRPAILGTANAFTTVDTDVGEGLEAALSILREKTDPLSFAARYACSSAAGGLRMIACGLVPSLTVEAARRAALGAGAKVVKVYSYELTEEDADEIATLTPDILLLTGGTDGGNRANIVQNAALLSRVGGDFPIVVAGNRAAAGECVKLLSGSSHETIVTENVMPVFNVLNIGPAQEVIRSLFLRRIVHAKGLTKQKSLLDGILMPTPAAVLSALTLLSEGLPGKPGIGDLVAVDLGGATTDVYSIADGLPAGVSTVLRGLPEPRAKRTVEGDIGMRYSAAGIIGAAPENEIPELSSLPVGEIMALLNKIQKFPDYIPEDDDFRRFDFALAVSAVSLALSRHAGTLERVYTPSGAMFQQTGKDLTDIQTMILTGGPMAFGGRAEEIARLAMERAGTRSDSALVSLVPKSARPVVDRQYILAAMGLLSVRHPEAALELLLRGMKETPEDQL